MSTTNTVNSVPYVTESRTVDTDVVAISKPEEFLELKTFDDIIEFAKTRRRFTRHDVQQHCYGKRLQRLIQRALQYNVIREVTYHDYEYNQDILTSYEEFTGWLQNRGRFTLEQVPSLDRYAWALRAKREGLVRQVNWSTWESVTAS